MIVGTTIFHLDGTPYYSPEFPRGGLSATFVVDVTHYSVTGADQFDIAVETRNNDETSWTAVGSATVTGAAVVTMDESDIRELVRFKYAFSGGSPVAADAVHFLTQAPSWRPF